MIKDRFCLFILALFGLVQSLRELVENQKADQIDRAFKEAWKYTDIPAPTSIFLNRTTKFLSIGYAIRLSFMTGIANFLRDNTYSLFQYLTHFS